MPNGQTKSNHWFIRITAPWEHIRGRMKEVKEKIWYDGMMIGYHHGDKKGAPHAHICLRLKSELQKQSIDNCFKKLFDVKGAQYSSKVWDGDKKAIAYLFHDVKGEVHNEMGMTDAEMNEVKELNVEIQKVVKENKGRASNKIVQYVLEQAGEQVWSRWDIGECILNAVAEGRFYDPGDFVLERYINEIELKMNYSDKQNLNAVIQTRLRRLKSFQ